MKKPWVLSYPLSAQRRLWSDWAGAQADLSLRWAHSHIVGFVMSQLIKVIQYFHFIDKSIKTSQSNWHVIWTLKLRTLNWIRLSKTVSKDNLYMHLFALVCESLSPPINGDITMSADGKTATYTCTAGFTVNGDSVRVCLMDGTAWNGTAPTCGKTGETGRMCRLIWAFAGRLCD